MKISNITVGLLLTVGVLGGCGNDHPPITQSPQSEVNTAVQMRVIFNKVNGDYGALSAEDKAEVLKLGGSQANVDSLWKTMSLNKPGAQAPTAPQH